MSLKLRNKNLYVAKQNLFRRKCIFIAEQFLLKLSFMYLSSSLKCLTKTEIVHAQNYMNKFKLLRAFKILNRLFVSFSVWRWNDLSYRNTLNGSVIRKWISLWTKYCISLLCSWILERNLKKYNIAVIS